MARNLYTLESAGTALTNSTTETVLASFVLPAYSMQVGKRYRVKAAVRVPVTNGTDTLRVRLRIGTATLTGTVIADGTAVDVANDDLIVFDLEGVVRAIGAGAAGATVVWTGAGTLEGAEGTVTFRAASESDTTDSSVDNYVQLTGTWSAASASDSAQAEYFTVDEL